MSHSDGHTGHGHGAHHGHGSHHDIDPVFDRGMLEHMTDVAACVLADAVARLNSGHFDDSLRHPPYSRALRAMTGPTDSRS